MIIDTTSNGNDGSNPLGIYYQNNKGERFWFNWTEGLPNRHNGAKATMKINSNDGTYITGTLNAELTLLDDSVVTFTNGEFKIKPYVSKKQSTDF